MIQALTLLGAFGVGIVLSFLGAVKLPLAKKLNIDDAKVGGLISALMFSCVVGVLIAGPLVDSFGHKPIIIMGFILSSLCIFVIANANTYSLAAVACLFLGLGGMCVSTVSSVLAPIVLCGGENAAAAQNLNNVFFGLGAFLIPMLVVVLARQLGSRGTISLVALLVLAPLIPALAATYPELNSSGFDFTRSLGLLTKPVILLAGLVLFCYVALEASMAGWITTYLTGLGASENKAGSVLSLFWVSIIVSRLIASFTVETDIAIQVTIGLTVLSIVGISLMIAAKSVSLGILAVILIGLSFGPNFPNVVGVTFSRIDQELWGSAFGIIFAIGLLGASIIPAAIGIYSKGKTIQKSMRIALVTAVALLVLAVGLWQV